MPGPTRCERKMSSSDSPLRADSTNESSITSLWNGGGQGPLAGVRVVDFGQYVAGPLVAMMFADQGADVVRVDPPGRAAVGQSG